MGDRGNIYFAEHAPGDGGVAGIYLYTHWGGSYVARIAQCGLARGRDRWNDEPYLARIVFNEMTHGAELETTGFGISSYVGDNEHDIVVVDTASQRVGLAHAAEMPKTFRSWSFAEFVALDLVKERLAPDPTPCAAPGLGVPSPGAPALPPELPAGKQRGLWGGLAVFALVALIFVVSRKTRS
ncbi:MAG: hypothetical protein ACXVEE_41870 [Polyangiales bacterium]